MLQARKSSRHLPIRALTLLVGITLILCSAPRDQSKTALAHHKSGHGGGPGGGGGGDGGDDGGNSVSFPDFMTIDLGGPGASARAINDLGGIVGYIDNRATYWQVDETGIRETVSLGPAGAVSSGAFDVNNLGHVVGSVRDGNSEATLWKIDNSGVTHVALPPLPGHTDSWAGAISSDSGLILGESLGYDANGELETSNVIWQVDAQNQVSVFELAGATESLDDVNKLGQVVGEGVGGVATVYQLTFDNDGVVIGVSEQIELGTLGGPYIRANAIDDFGNVSGTASIDEEVRNAVVWRVDDAGDLISVTNLGRLREKDTRAAAYDLNTTDTGAIRQVVGNSGQPGSKGRQGRENEWLPFLWQEGEMTDLNSLLVDDGGFTKLYRPEGINADGWLVGRGEKDRQNHAYVTIPVGGSQATSVPEPSTLLMLVLVCVTAFRGLRRNGLLRPSALGES